MRPLDITEVAQRSGVAASTLRFYEQKGLIASIGRRGLRRQFAPGVLERLAVIALLGRPSGFSLKEIASMFAPDGRVRIDRQMLTAMECPNFRRSLQSAKGRRLTETKHRPKRQR